MNNTNILIVGVGGQGTVLASKICGYVAETAGMDVKLSEIHGMSQRGGSVVTHVRMGEKVYSPLIMEGMADIIMAFEELEGLRWLKYLKEKGIIIVNTQQILPMPVIVGNAKYPQAVTAEMNKLGVANIPIDAAHVAGKLGTSKAANVVLIGALAKKLDFPKEYWLQGIKAAVKPEFLELNLAAFEAGYNMEETQ